MIGEIIRDRTLVSATVADDGTRSISAESLSVEDQRILALPRLTTRTVARLQPMLTIQEREADRAAAWLKSIERDVERHPVVDRKIVITKAPKAIISLLQRHRANPVVTEARDQLLNLREHMARDAAAAAAATAAAASAAAERAAIEAARAQTTPAPTSAPAPASPPRRETIIEEIERLHAKYCESLPLPDEIENELVRAFLIVVRDRASDRDLMQAAVAVGANPEAAEDVMRHGAAFAAEYYKREQMAARNNVRPVDPGRPRGGRER